MDTREARELPAPFPATRLPRRELARWTKSLRKHDPIDLLNEAYQGRLPRLAALKNQRMAASAFGFFRGAAPVMAYDLSLGPNTGICAQLCGDAHVQNLGAFCGLDDRLVFDISDFDETIRGPFEWDVKRMTASILLAGRDASLKKSASRAAARTFLAAYCDLTHRFAAMPILEVARYQVHRLEAVAPISAILRNAERSTPLSSLEKLTEPAHPGSSKSPTRRFKSDPPLLRRLAGDDAAAVLRSLPTFRETILPERQHFFDQFRPVDVAFKVVGTGSVGLRDYVVYLTGNGPGDPLFLQIKEEAVSAYAPYLPQTARLQAHQGQRVVEGQRAMQIQSDPLLGWTTLDGRHFLVRQLNDHKASVDIASLRPIDLTQYAEVCGEMLARGHARSADARLTAAYIRGGRRFTEAILRYATAYADQTVADWKHFVRQHKSSRA